MSDSGFTYDYFISHADRDAAWAEWIAGELEGRHHKVLVQARDFLPGENALTRLNEALLASRHTIGLVTPAYLSTETATSTAAYFQSLTGKERALIPIRLEKCEPSALFDPLIDIDLTGTDERQARERLDAGLPTRAEVSRDAVPRPRSRSFPGQKPNGARFPHADTVAFELRGHRADPHFTGRDEVLAELHRSLRAGRPTSPVQVITGLWGLGKTRLAIEYANRHAPGYDIVWWVRSEDPAILKGDCVGLARELGLPCEQDDEALAALRQELGRRRDWLLIFDNAVNPDDVFPLLPDRHSGHVLVTSQSRDWSPGEVHRLDVLALPAAIGYLRDKGGVADPAQARTLAETLGCLPLALAQAASLIRDGLTATEYLHMLKTQSPELFGEGGQPDYRDTLDATWRMSRDRLARRSPGALALLRLTSFLAAEAIPLGLLTPVDGMPEDLVATLTRPIQRTKATRALGEYSLADTADGLLSVHRMVQTLARADLGVDEPAWAGFALATMAEAVPADPSNPARWDTCDALIGHAATAAEHASRLGVGGLVAAALLNRVARYLFVRGRYEQALSRVGEALTAVTADENPAVYLDCRATLGEVLQSRGDDHAARAIHEEVYAARSTILGPAHVDTLRSGLELAQALHELGRDGEATILQNKIVDTSAASLGHEHPGTITAWAYQATLLRTAGRLQDALELETRVVQARQALLGEDHPDTILAIGNLAATHLHQGQLKHSRSLGERAVTLSRRVLGERHPRTLMALGDLAVALSSLGELGRARGIAEESRDTARRALGEVHPVTLAAKARLATIMGELGELGVARDLQQEVLDALAQQRGEGHPSTLVAMVESGSILRSRGDLAAARHRHERAVELWNDKQNPEHPQRLAAVTELAMTLNTLGEHTRARSMLEESHRIRQRALGDRHPHTVAGLTYLAAVLFDQGNLREAQALQEEAVRVRREIFGDGHPATLTSIRNLAKMVRPRGDRARSLGLLREAHAASVTALGERNTLSSEIAWDLAHGYDAPHEAAPRRALLARLAWLSKAPPNNLSAEQKHIRTALKAHRRS